MSERVVQPEHPTDAWDLYPHPEDWNDLQGGMPRVFYNPNKPQARWIVLHVYDEHEKAEKRFMNGSIVATAPPLDSGIQFSRFHIKKFDDVGKEYERDISIPSMMRIDTHGAPCEQRSISAGGGAYPRIRNQDEYENHIESLRLEGMTELRYAVRDNKLQLIPLDHIRSARPL